LECVEKPSNEVTLYFHSVRICNRPIEKLVLGEIVGHEMVIAPNHVDVVVDPTEHSTLNYAVDADEDVFEVAGIVVYLSRDRQVKTGR
jgi:hypothetical protein